MVHNCSAYGCSNKTNIKIGLHLHNFPLKNKPLLKKWLKAIRRANFTPSVHSRICSEHFLPNDFQIRPGYESTRLRENAIPSIFSFNKPTQESPAEPSTKKKLEMRVTRARGKQGVKLPPSQSNQDAQAKPKPKRRRKNSDDNTLKALKAANISRQIRKLVQPIDKVQQPKKHKMLANESDFSDTDSDSEVNTTSNITNQASASSHSLKMEESASCEANNSTSENIENSNNGNQCPNSENSMSSRFNLSDHSYYTDIGLAVDHLTARNEELVKSLKISRQKIKRQQKTIQRLHKLVFGCTCNNKMTGTDGTSWGWQGFTREETALD